MNWILNVLAFSNLPHSQAQTWAALVCDRAIKGTIILIAAFAVSLALRRASAAARHFVWTLAISSLLAVPVLSLFLPAWEIPFSLSPRAQFPATIGLEVTHSADASISDTSVRAGVQQPAPRNPSHPDWTSWALLVWAAGILAVWSRLLIGIIRVWRMTRDSKRVERVDWTSALQELRVRLQLKRHITLVHSDRASVPMTCGLFRSVIVLPSKAGDWRAERLRAVLAHELAHVKRHDCLGQILTLAACGLYWFNPLVWLAARQLRKESERACDDQVLGLGTRPSEYAEHLLELARSLQFSDKSWTPAVAIVRRSRLESRMAALLDPKLNHHTLSRTNGLVAVFATLALVLPIAAAQRPSVPLQARDQTTKAEKPHSPPEQPQMLQKSTETAGHQQPRAEQKEPEQRTGRIWGKVYDASGGVIPLAIVTLINSDLKVTQSVPTNDAGIFEFPAIPAGRYLLEVIKPGFGFLERQNLLLKAGADLRLDVVLNIATVTERVEVVERSHRKAAPAPVQKPLRIRVGGNVEQAKQIFAPKPEYPPEAKEKGVEGTVLLNAVIGMQGNVLDIRVINEPDPELAKAALDAVKQWRYQPTLLNGQPVEVVTTITVSFRLEKPPDGGN